MSVAKGRNKRDAERETGRDAGEVEEGCRRGHAQKRPINFTVTRQERCGSPRRGLPYIALINNKWPQNEKSILYFLPPPHEVLPRPFFFFCFFLVAFFLRHSSRSSSRVSSASRLYTRNVECLRFSLM